MGLPSKNINLLIRKMTVYLGNCILCSIDDTASKFPFGYLSKMELNDLYGIDLLSQLQLLPSFELRSKLSHIPNLDDFDIDVSFIHSVHSKYYDIHDFSNSTSSLSKGLALFHVNIRSLSKHIDQLKTVLSMSKRKFDLIGISESKQKVDCSFIVNVDLEGYHMYNQPSKLASGGVVLYVNDSLDHLKRNEFCTTEDEFESLWVEIKNQKSKNIMCGCMYRHPNTDVLTFLEYIESTISKI